MKNIITQMQGYAVPTNIGMMDLFQEDVRIILKEDKVYYHLPDAM